MKAHGLEGVIAKRLDIRYEPGQRSGAWQKTRANQGQEFVIGGYTASPRNFDALIRGYYEGEKLLMLLKLGTGLCQLREQNCIGVSGCWKISVHRLIIDPPK